MSKSLTVDSANAQINRIKPADDDDDDDADDGGNNHKSTDSDHHNDYQRHIYTQFSVLSDIGSITARNGSIQTIITN